MSRPRLGDTRLSEMFRCKYSRVKGVPKDKAGSGRSSGSVDLGTLRVMSVGLSKAIAWERYGVGSCRGIEGHCLWVTGRRAEVRGAGAKVDLADCWEISRKIDWVIVVWRAASPLVSLRTVRLYVCVARGKSLCYTTRSGQAESLPELIDEHWYEETSSRMSPGARHRRKDEEVKTPADNSCPVL